MREMVPREGDNIKTITGTVGRRGFCRRVDGLLLSPVDISSSAREWKREGELGRVH